MSTRGPGLGQDWPTRLAIGVVTSLITAGLIGAGTWLAGNQVPKETETVLQFSLLETRVGGLSTWYVRLSNVSPYAFDLEFAKPTQEVLRAEYQPPSPDSAGWKGRLLRGTSLEALFVINNPNVRISQKLLDSLVRATYQERDERTGLLESRNAVLLEASAIPLSRTLLLVTWFLVPFALAGLMVFGGRKLFRSIKGGKTTTTAADPPRA